MFIQLNKEDGTPFLANTNNIDMICKKADGIKMWFNGDDNPISANNDYDQISDIIMAHEKKKTAIETGTVNVKIVNPR